MEIQTVMSDYQAIDGVMVARNLRTTMGGQQVAGVTFSAVEFNLPIDDAEFVMPK